MLLRIRYSMLLGLNNDISLFCNSYIGYKINSIVFISLIQRIELELIFEVLIDSFMKCFYIKFNKGKYEKLESSSRVIDGSLDREYVINRY